MSRTAHHTPPRRRAVPPYWPNGTAGPCTAHWLTDLRYSRRELARAAREGRRPRPLWVRRGFAAYVYPRTLGVRGDSPYERRARAALRAFSRAAVKDLRAAGPGRLRAAGPGRLWEAAAAFDLPPTRHRHRDLWEA
ncbi:MULTISPECIES: hypothetical protein [unclassified Streptomyces]|uniref:hypothetical protein n=1 Tax=unclassified Streptomyces TaxID=2593676 RepID=UPI00202EE7CF|nr:MULTISPECIES: hypothetical protein [unclassified Streptomyces]MCM1974872.1 hypothetical protein [Streptomyces sp. G1]